MTTALRFHSSQSFGLFAACLVACSTSTTDEPTTAPAQQPQAASAPTYQELFAEYFAPGTPGHCATAGCHADPGHNVWLCSDAESCFRGMVEVGLIELDDPMQSEIADPQRSPLTWFNTAGGNMPFDAQEENAAGRAAIEAWVAAGAQDD